MNGAEHLTTALVRQGVELLFGYPGGAILPFYDALMEAPSIRHILVRHEQGAALAANGYARACGRVGVCVATSGPGATNLVTGVADAFMDSIPMVIITGQVPTAMMGMDAFQEIDVLGLTMPIVKHSYLITDPNELPTLIPEAFAIARSGRPGPVWIDIPKDVLLAEVDSDPITIEPSTEASAPLPSRHALERALELLEEAERPLVYAGGGIPLAGAVDALRGFVHSRQLPTVLTLKGLGALSGDDPLFLGMLGMHGLKAANYAVQHCDLLICVGARFDDRVTGRLDGFAPKAKVIHLDIDPAEVGKRRRADAAVLGDLKVALAALQGPPLAIEPWRRWCRGQILEHGWPYREGATIDAPSFLKDLSLAAARKDHETCIACDVGQHQMWVAQHYHFRRPEHHLSSSGLGTMGFGLPAAIGAQLAKPDAAVINISGDGSFMMNVQELATVARYGLPVKMVVLDNQALGMVRQWQELFLDARYSETDLSDNPDFVTVGQAFGIPGIRAERPDQIPELIERLLNTPGPLLAHVLIRPQDNVWPFVPPGASNSIMMEG
ncbi:MAG: acetolactate synthase 2 catalytic subunit [Myxococcota bacterium]